jgi:hypothetical protein
MLALRALKSIVRPEVCTFAQSARMILYNVTVSIDDDAAENWLEWMKEVHIPEVLATGCFVNARIARILAEEQGGKAYSVQYYAASMEAFEQYESTHADRLRTDHQLKYGAKTAAFRTLLQIVHDSDG